MATSKDGIAPSLRERITFLQQPQSYPDLPDAVQLVQTHISVVALAGNYAYKLKKPVNFEFLDFSSVDQRRIYCFKEVELNRRLCFDIYLGVLPIYRHNGSLKFGEHVYESAESLKDSDGEPIDFVVKMKRLSDQYFLSHKITHGEFHQRDLEYTTQKLADFYQQQQAVSDRYQRWGNIETIQKNIDENFQQTEPFLGRLIPEISHHTVQTFTRLFIERHASLFRQRVEEDAIVDGHGDLHLDHIHVKQDKVCIYDCIEFNERFRYQDIANDIAFLAMDLDRYRRYDLSRRFIRWMSEELEDQNLLRLIDFYKCYRAVVRGKVEALKSQDREIIESERQEAETRARQYFHLALRYAVIGSRPVAFIVMGKIGTGKSTLSHQLARHLDLSRFNSDRIRKELAGIPVREPSPRSIHDFLYSQIMSDRTYNVLLDRSLDQLRKGRSVILDATFSRRAKRQELIRQLKQLGANYYFIEMKTRDERIKQRLKNREQRSQIISDARLENFEPLNRIYQPPSEIARGRLIHMDTEQSVEKSTRLLLKKLVNAQVNQT